MIWRSIYYDWPEGSFLIVLAVLAGIGFALLHRYRLDKLRLLGRKTVLETIVEDRSPLSYWSKSVLGCMAIIFSILALMQPKGNERYVAPQEGTRAVDLKSIKQMHYVLLLIDASASMGVADMSGRTRLETAKEMADGIVRGLQGEQVAVFVFTSTGMEIVPLTADYLFARLMIRQVRINEGETSGTNLQQALEAVRKQYFSSPSLIPKTLVMFTDGGDTLYETVPGKSQEEVLESIIKPVADANERLLNVVMVGMGTRQGGEVPNVKFDGKSIHSSLNLPVMNALIRASKGKLLLADQSSPNEISKNILFEITQAGFHAQENQTEIQKGSNISKVYDLYFQYPLGLGIVALALYMLIPNTRRKKIISCLMWLSFSSFLAAQVDREIFNRAKIDFEAGNYELSREKYEELLINAQGWERAVLLYDIGTTFLKERQWEEAQSHFDRVLTLGIESPQLLQRVTVNLALTHLMIAKINLMALQSNPKATDQEYYQAMLAIQDVQYRLEEARRAHCAFVLAKGESQCLPSLSLEQINHEVQELNSTLIKLYSRAEKDISLDSYQGLIYLSTLALMQNSIEENTLTTLAKIETNLYNELQSSNALSKDFLKKSMTFLKEAQKAKQSGKEVKTRIFLEIARQLAVKAYQTTNNKINKNAEFILRESIAQERFALHLNRLWLGNQKNNEILEMQELLFLEQKNVIDEAAPFLDKVKQQQASKYADNSERDTLPWDQIIVLFSQGNDAAKEAANHLVIDKFNLLQAQRLQLEAMDNWKQVLALMHSSQKNKNTSQQQSLPSSQASSAEESASKQPSQIQDGNNAILRLIQEMEQDDQSKEQRKISSEKGDGRPW